MLCLYIWVGIGSSLSEHETGPTHGFLSLRGVTFEYFIIIIIIITMTWAVQYIALALRPCYFQLTKQKLTYNSCFEDYFYYTGCDSLISICVIVYRGGDINCESILRWTTYGGSAIGNPDQNRPDWKTNRSILHFLKGYIMESKL